MKKKKFCESPTDWITLGWRVLQWTNTLAYWVQSKLWRKKDFWLKLKPAAFLIKMTECMKNYDTVLERRNYVIGQNLWLLLIKADLSQFSWSFPPQSNILCKLGFIVQATAFLIKMTEYMRNYDRVLERRNYVIGHNLWHLLIKVDLSNFFVCLTFCLSYFSLLSYVTWLSYWLPSLYLFACLIFTIIACLIFLNWLYLFFWLSYFFGCLTFSMLYYFPWLSHFSLLYYVFWLSY